MDKLAVLSSIVCVTILWSFFIKAENVDDYLVSFERLEQEYSDPNVYKANISVTKHNRTTVKTEIEFETFQVMDHDDAMMDLFFYKFNQMVGYELIQQLPQLDVCVIIPTGMFGLQMFFVNSNLKPECPVPMNRYYMKDITLSTNLSHYNLPAVPEGLSGRWKTQAKLYSNKKLYSVINAYITISKAIRWQ